MLNQQADRKVNYERVAEATGEKWLPVVKHMRRQAEKGNLRFPMNAPTPCDATKRTASSKLA